MTSSDSPLISVVIVTYNTKQMTVDCLTSLQKRIGEAKVSAEIFLVDNDSKDDTLEVVEANFPDVILIANKENVGFGSANNQAMSKARGRYFLLLNSDAFLEADALSLLIARLDVTSSLGVIGPYLLNEDGSHQKSIHAFTSPKLAWQQFLGISKASASPESSALPSELSGKSYLKGACLLLRREVYEKVGGFDEAFFFYGEEADWQKRIIDSSFKLGFVENAKVTHLEGKSGKKVRLRSTVLYYVGVDFFIYKHFSKANFYFYRLGVTVWCLRKLALFYLRRIGKKRNLFAEKMHEFLLSHIFSSPAKLKADALNVKEI